jgi:hypothetical protein
MEQKAIGFKLNWKPVFIMMLVVAGLGAIVGGICFYVFVMQGAMGGAVAGAAVFCGGALIAMGGTIRFLPKDLVFIDEENVYFHKKAPVKIADISEVIAQGNGLTLRLKQSNKPVQQGFLRNSAECAQIIKEKMTI